MKVVGGMATAARIPALSIPLTGQRLPREPIVVF
jgi:hypothetical protein